MLFGDPVNDTYRTSQKSFMNILFLTVLIIFKQKYELQIYSKYKLENLNFGKVFHLPTFCVMTGLGYWLTDGF